jgi:MFS family permease
MAFMSDRSAVRRLALGDFLSSTGSGIAAVALSFFVYQQTNSAIWLAGTLFFTFGVAGLITPFAGKIADRYDRRRVMIASDLLSLATWGTLIFTREPSLLAGIGFVATVVSLPYWLAAEASIPNLVEEADLPWANGLISAASSTARLLGPALGGALFALGGAGLAFGVNAASFGVSALVTLSLRGRSFSAEPSEDEGQPTGAFEGFRVIRADPMLLWITISWTLMWFAMNIAFVADPPLATGFGVGAFGYGMIDTFFGAGALIGALLAMRIIHGRERLWIAAGMAAVAAGWATIAITPWLRSYSSRAGSPRRSTRSAPLPDERSSSDAAQTPCEDGCSLRNRARDWERTWWGSWSSGRWSKRSAPVPSTAWEPASR